MQGSTSMGNVKLSEREKKVEEIYTKQQQKRNFSKASDLAWLGLLKTYLAHNKRSSILNLWFWRKLEYSFDSLQSHRLDSEDLYLMFFEAK